MTLVKALHCKSNPGQGACHRQLMQKCDCDYIPNRFPTSQMMVQYWAPIPVCFFFDQQFSFQDARD